MLSSGHYKTKRGGWEPMAAMPDPYLISTEDVMPRIVPVDTANNAHLWRDILAKWPVNPEWARWMPRKAIDQP